MPVAAVHLEDQSNPNEAAGFFVSDDYGEALSDAIAKHGTRSVLAGVKARLFINKIDQHALARRMKNKAEATMKSKYENKVLGMTERFLDSLRIAVAGFNKNLWNGDNELKAALDDEFSRLGITNPTPYIEAAFERAGDTFFEDLIAKASELHAKSDETLDEFRKMVSEASTQMEGDDGEIVDDTVNRLVEGNFNVDTSREVVPQRQKRSIRDKLHLSASGLKR